MTLAQAGVEVRPGVYRFGDGHVNWYIVERSGSLTVFDGGMPTHWSTLIQWLAQRRLTMANVEAIVLTHGHPDHLGITQRLAEATGLSVHIHELDEARAKGDGLQKMPRRLARNLWRPHTLATVATWGRAGMFTVPPIVSAVTLRDGDVLDVPGRPRAIHMPGHSAGSASFVLDGEDTLIAGDALVTQDVITGKPGLGIMPGLLNDDPEEALASLRGLEGLAATSLLPGHGEPFVGEWADMLRQARAAGIDWRIPPVGSHGHVHR